ncbi:hypothetical protein ACTWPT_09525 [Nonomuraea sp. 3N208]|uniref:hypothetical protein n=1 Tax=Nonomuraea sp. 3N208 TaxID=3457421 RepID=UPI003FCD133D
MAARDTERRTKLVFDPNRMEASLHALLGLHAVGVGRALDMGIIDFDPAPPDTWADDWRSAFALHLQCPFRITYESRVILGSADLAWLEREVRGTGETESERTMYDFMADRVDATFTELRPTVTAVRVSPFGDLHVDLEREFTVQAFPAGSGRAEAWRFLRRGAEHVVFPPDEQVEEQ